MNEVLVTKYEQALQTALRAHFGQRDKAGEPYIKHILRVARGVERRFPDTDELVIAALLHDVVEDTFGTDRQITLRDILCWFGMMTMLRVDALTRRVPGMEYLDGQTWKTVTEKEIYLRDYIPRLCKRSATARHIKEVDLLDNLDPARRLKIPANPAQEMRYQVALHKVTTFQEWMMSDPDCMHPSLAEELQQWQSAIPKELME